MKGNLVFIYDWGIVEYPEGKREKLNTEGLVSIWMKINLNIVITVEPLR